MKMIMRYHKLFALCSFLCCAGLLNAQTDMDAIMMAKNNFCSGLMYGHSSWNQYWEGTTKRSNQNLGTVSTVMYSYMGNYGISDKLNVLFSIPYVETKASQGNLHGMKGFQDLSLWVKWNPIERVWGKYDFSLYGLTGLSVPSSNYIADYLPLSIGLHSTNISMRAIADCQKGHLFSTVSATYILRSNVTTDRPYYYSTEQLLTDQIYMPAAGNFQLRAGYRSSKLIAEAILNRWVTFGGFDITRNNMPFPANRMNATTLGVNIKYEVPYVSGLSLIGSGSGTLAGRNMGQASSFGAGIFYVLDFTHSSGTKKSVQTSKK